MHRSSESNTMLEVLLTETALRLLAGPTSFARGERYAASERVKQLKMAASELTATVIGTSRYWIRIWADEGCLNHFCSCPMGESGEFCKHCVAAGLVWLGATGPTERATGRSEPDQPVADLQAYLLSHSKEALVELL